MGKKYYNGEQILEALSEVGVGAGDISEVMSCLGRRELNNNSTKVDRKNDNLIRRQDAIDAMMQLQDEDIEAYGCEIPEGFDGDRAVMVLKELPSAEPNLQPTCNQLATEIIRCKDCKHRFLQDRIWQCPFAIPAFDNYFCAYAERKTDERSD